MNILKTVKTVLLIFKELKMSEKEQKVQRAEVPKVTAEMSGRSWKFYK